MTAISATAVYRSVQLSRTWANKLTSSQRDTPEKRSAAHCVCQKDFQRFEIAIDQPRLGYLASEYAFSGVSGEQACAIGLPLDQNVKQKLSESIVDLQFQVGELDRCNSILFTIHQSMISEKQRRLSLIPLASRYLQTDRLLTPNSFAARLNAVAMFSIWHRS